MKQGRIAYQLAKLIDVKSLVTLSLIAALVSMTLRGQEVSSLFSNAVMLVLGFFFGKAPKNDREGDPNARD